MKKSAFFYILILFFITACGEGSSLINYSGDAALEDQELEDRSVYDQDSLNLITLNVTIQSGATLAEINLDTDPDDDSQPEAVATISEDGYTFSDGTTTAAGIFRIRGNTSRLADQKSYRFKIDSNDVLWRNHRTLQLNKHPYEITRMRQKLSFDYLKTVSYMSSLRTQFIHLYIDGVDHGLYTLIERCNELENHGMDRDGHIYKVENFEFYRYADTLLNNDDPDYNADLFETILRIRGEEGNHTKLLAMLDDVNDYEKDINDIVSNHFHRNNYITWLAVNILLGNDDTNSQNYFLYSPSTSNKWYFLPWDYDGAWDFYGQPVEAVDDDRPRWTEGIANWWGNVLHKRFIQDADNLQDIIDKVEDLRANVFTVAQTTAYLDVYTDIVFDLITASPDLEELQALDDDTTDGIIAELTGEIDRLSAIPEESYQTFITALQRPMPIYLNDAVVGDGTVNCSWEESYDLQGDDITYDLTISTDPNFAAGDIVYEDDTSSTSVDITTLTSGTYYYRVIIRDDADPDTNWQMPFSYYTDDAGTDYQGMKQFTVE